jgi:hypothetical protein
MQYALDLSQRWRERRSSFAPPASCIRPGDYTIERIARREAAAFLTQHHYLRTTPVAVTCAGLFHKPGLAPAQLVGVAVFGQPGSPDAIAHRCGMEAKAGLELTRFALLDEVPFNGETFFSARALRLLRHERPEIRAVVACSDPMPRTDYEGRQIFPGHQGQIYKASNAIWSGTASTRTVHLCRDGSVLPDRSLSKIRRQKQGAQAAAARILAAGAPERRWGESPAAWLERALTSPAFRKIKHPGVRVYVLPMDPQARKIVEATNNQRQ